VGQPAPGVSSGEPEEVPGDRARLLRARDAARGVVGVALELAAVARLGDQRRGLLHQEDRRLQQVDGR
jgi:hypothetical protein